MKIVLATRNQHKYEEMKAILKDLDLDLLCALDFPDLPDVEEDQDTIEGNSIKKAKEVAQNTQLPALADDTGFFIEALNDEPGVFAARFAGEGCTYADNVNKVLTLMQGEAHRNARFETVVTLAFPNQDEVITAKGIINGQIIEHSRGQSGFGYDPIFVPDNYTQTFAELSDQEKNKISHRARAIQAIIPKIKANLEQ